MINDAFRPFGRPIYGLGAQTLAPKRHFSTFFSVIFQQKYVEVAINDFTMHLIISKWLRMQNADRREKQ